MIKALDITTSFFLLILISMGYFLFTYLAINEILLLPLSISILSAFITIMSYLKYILNEIDIVDENTSKRLNSIVKRLGELEK